MIHFRELDSNITTMSLRFIQIFVSHKQNRVYENEQTCFISIKILMKNAFDLKSKAGIDFVCICEYKCGRMKRYQV